MLLIETVFLFSLKWKGCTLHSCFTQPMQTLFEGYLPLLLSALHREKQNEKECFDAVLIFISISRNESDPFAYPEESILPSAHPPTPLPSLPSLSNSISFIFCERALTLLFLPSGARAEMECHFTVGKTVYSCQKSSS